jgi:hypothetical protein
VLGTDAARALVLAVTVLMGRTIRDTAALVRSLPSYKLARVQWEAQGLTAQVLVEVERVVSVVVTETGALEVLTSPQGAQAGAMLSRNGSVSAAPTPGRPSVVKVLRHRGGNLQVTLSNGQRWHLPRGKSLQDIPAEDSLGDELQEAANRLAKQWGPRELSVSERSAIDDALERGEYFQASRLEGQARGRWIERKLRNLFTHLEWNHRGVDVTGPNGSKYHYEVLSGTEDNFGRHGRRMFDVFFRMIFF